MINKALMALFCTITIPLSAVAGELNQVFIEGNDIGQGFTVKRLNQCYFISPLHVVDGSFFLTLKGSDNQRSLGDGQPLQPFGYDLSVGHVSGALSEQCGLEFNSLSVEQTDIERAKTVVVATVNTDGLISRMPAVIEETGLIYLSAKTLSEDKPFYKGMSGSMVYANGQIVGMLQSVDNATGFGQVLRFDRLLETVGPFFTTSNTTNITKPQPPAKIDSLPYQLSAWNLPPTSNELSPQLITDGNPDTYYSVSLQSGYLELDFTFAAQQDIQSVKLVLPEEAGVKDFEILSSRRESGKRGWISVKSGTVLPKETEVIVQLGKVNARRLKLKIHSSWNDNGLIKLSDISVY